MGHPGQLLWPCRTRSTSPPWTEISTQGEFNLFAGAVVVDVANTHVEFHRGPITVGARVTGRDEPLVVVLVFVAERRRPHPPQSPAQRVEQLADDVVVPGDASVRVVAVIGLNE